MRTEIAVMLCALAIVGCAPRVAVKPPMASEAAYAHRGATVKFPHPAGYLIEGELLAVEGGTVYVQQFGQSEILAAPAHDVYNGVVWNYRPNAGTVLVWGLVGTAATIFHGWWLILSAPTWIGSTAGIAALIGASGRSQRATPEWARYPQGLPEALRGQVVETPGWIREPTTPGTPVKAKPSTPAPVL